MRRGITCAAVGLVALAALAVPTSDARVLDGTPRIEIARTIAMAAFPQSANHCADVRIESRTLPGYRGLAYWWECRIELDTGWRTWGIDTLCSIMVHEYGHIARLRFPDNPEDPVHSTDPNNIMHATVHNTGMLPLCEPLGPAEYKLSVYRTETRRVVARYRRAISPTVRHRLKRKVRWWRKHLRKAQHRFYTLQTEAVVAGQQYRVTVPGF